MKLLIIGNGVAGINAALTARARSEEADITVVSDESDWFFSRTALMYAFMDRMTRRDLEPYERHVWERQRIRLVRGRVADLDANAHTVSLDDDRSLDWDRLILATGARARTLDLPGMDEVSEGIVTFVTMRDLDHCERLTPSTDRAVVVGGGLIGIELVECLLHHGVKVTYLLREDRYWPTALPREESAFVLDRLRHHGADVIAGDELASVQAGDDGRVASITTREGLDLPCRMLGLCIGVTPRVEAFRRVTTPPEIGRGFRVDDSLATSLDGVLACGDCAEIVPAEGQSFVESIWYSARDQGRVAGANAVGAREHYRRPIFYNSSMLMDVPYTTVGRSMELPHNTPTLYRRMPDKPISQRILHDGERVLGFILLGSDWDHEMLERWIREERPLSFVRKHLREAQYDVEFGRVPLDRMEEQELPLHSAPEEDR